MLKGITSKVRKLQKYGPAFSVLGWVVMLFFVYRHEVGLNQINAEKARFEAIDQRIDIYNKLSVHLSHSVEKRLSVFSEDDFLIVLGVTIRNLGEVTVSCQLKDAEVSNYFKNIKDEFKQSFSFELQNKDELEGAKFTMLPKGHTLLNFNITTSLDHIDEKILLIKGVVDCEAFGHQLGFILQKGDGSEGDDVSCKRMDPSIINYKNSDAPYTCSSYSFDHIGLLQKARVSEK